MSDFPESSFTRVSGKISGRCLRLCLCLSAALLFLTSRADEAEMRFDAVIQAAAQKHKIDPLLIKALIWQESRFSPTASGKNGEAGLMQIRHCVAADWSKANRQPRPEPHELFDPYINLEIGTWYLARSIRYWKDARHVLSMALWEYNAGRFSIKQKLKQHDQPHDFDPAAESATASTAYIRAIWNKYLEYITDAAPRLASDTPQNP